MVDILTAITTSLRTVSANVHFSALPDDPALLEDHSIVFTLSNTDNQSTIDNPELIRNLFCEVRINSAKTTKNRSNNESVKVASLIDPVKTVMYSLPCYYIKRNYQDFFYDDNLGVWTSFQRFELQA